MFEFKRSLKEITRFSTASSVWCRRERMILWDVGNFHGDQSASSLLNKVIECLVDCYVTCLDLDLVIVVVLIVAWLSSSSSIIINYRHAVYIIHVLLLHVLKLPFWCFFALSKDYLDRHPTGEDRQRAFKDSPALASFYRDRYPEVRQEKKRKKNEKDEM
jgi:hypothetical protein